MMTGRIAEAFPRGGKGQIYLYGRVRTDGIGEESQSLWPVLSYPSLTLKEGPSGKSLAPTGSSGTYRKWALGF